MRRSQSPDLLGQIREMHGQIAAGNPASLYILHGEDRYRRDQVAKNIPRWILPESERELSLTVLDADEVELTDIAGALEGGTLSFFGGRQVVLIRRAAFFARSQENDSGYHTLYRRLSGELPPDLTVVVQAEKVDGRNKLFKSARENAVVLEFPAASRPQELLGFVQDRLRQSKVSATRGAIDLVMALCSPEPGSLAMEVHKLASYVGEGGTVTEEIVRELVPMTQEALVWDLADAIGERDVGRAVSLAAQRLWRKESPVWLVSLVTNRVRLMLQARALMDDGKLPRNYRSNWPDCLGTEIVQSLPEDRTANLARQHPYVAQKVIQAAQAFGLEELKRCLDACLSAERTLKTTSSLSERDVLDLLVITICRGGEGGEILKPKGPQRKPIGR